MAKYGRSARGEIVDFDMIAITQALAEAPAPISVQARRNFIEEKQSSRAIRAGMVAPAAVKEAVVPAALQIATAAAKTSSKTKTAVSEELATTPLARNLNDEH